VLTASVSLPTPGAACHGSCRRSATQSRPICLQPRLFVQSLPALQTSLSTFRKNMMPHSSGQSVVRYLDYGKYFGPNTIYFTARYSPKIEGTSVIICQKDTDWRSTAPPPGEDPFPIHCHVVWLEARFGLVTGFIRHLHS
jgi:hypothetical protein